MFTLKLSTEEIKTLQNLLETHKSRTAYPFWDESCEAVLTKILLAQLPDEEPKKDTGRISFQCVPIF